MITFRDVSVVYPTGTKGLDGVTLEIPDGQFVVVVGLSGAGKSTLVRAVNGLVPVTSGELEVNGQRVDSASKRELRRLRARVGMIFQSFNLVTRVSVLKNVLMGRLARTSTLATLVGAYGAANREIAFEALERVGIVEKAYVRASQLSGGQQQRVAIARVLAQQPDVVLADEPVASLDPPTANAVMRDLRRVQRELGITTIVNLHFLDLAKAYADRIIGMRAGKVVFDGVAADADDAVFEQIYGRSLTAEDVSTVDVGPIL
ncbi:phosphonate ABC transporter, ATPase subunit [Beutenbergia cavernae DSM 12333]|uniref:Phosphonate ABC transporter, ATPase subunit n=1 Tax=Beutenbergia cavernae (strain ATCC BAA-8 / DSM 12333 / CCUG 43141 / JCM 11478 / NBRC 16432 / NCIMB 13614 / HKI 0122) TaxID=471853 RepID=C5BXN9_BEUC1|nr:phosphonate ABC transporter ATP-binding protein [Beutenbergia cavernae]ACQ80922.1 phosphonate ABC transporter, ATPase subunit [Beutenbergia cavernae DSM 12333]